MEVKGQGKVDVALLLGCVSDPKGPPSQDSPPASPASPAFSDWEPDVEADVCHMEVDLPQIPAETGMAQQPNYPPELPENSPIPPMSTNPRGDCGDSDIPANDDDTLDMVRASTTAFVASNKNKNTEKKKSLL